MSKKVTNNGIDRRGNDRIEYVRGLMDGISWVSKNLL